MFFNHILSFHPIKLLIHYYSSQEQFDILGNLLSDGELDEEKLISASYLSVKYESTASGRLESDLVGPKSNKQA